MDKPEMATGMATGWSTFKASFGSGWQWNAWGPGGGSTGTAPDEATAIALAKQAHEGLRRPNLRGVS